MKKPNIFFKIVILIVALIIPCIAIYTITNNKSIKVVKEQIQISKINELTILSSQIDHFISQLNSSSIMLLNDIETIKYAKIDDSTKAFDRMIISSNLERRLALHHYNQNWQGRITVFSVKREEFVTTDSRANYNKEHFYEKHSSLWKYINEEGYKKVFIRHIAYPLNFNNEPEKAHLILEIMFSQETLINFLDTFNVNQSGQPFLYEQSSSNIISNKKFNEEITNYLSEYMHKQELKEIGSFNFKYKKKNYMANYVKLENLNWYLVYYVPLSEILQPISQTRWLFYISILILVIMSIIAAYLLYKNVQSPIHELIVGVNNIESGNLSTRVGRIPNNEFSYLFKGFNKMACKIEQLIENEYKQKLRYSEATLKQLQSQINSHFLYNCLAFIINMTKLKNEKAVIEMAYNLSDYYRYKIRIDKSVATIKDEIKLISSYLTIQSMQFRNLTFVINVDESMEDILIPRLLLQPIVENAVIHGIEPKFGTGEIQVDVFRRDDKNYIIIKDNGVGISENKIILLKDSFTKDMDEKSRCGMWNINSRLKYYFGEESRLQIYPIPEGGTEVLIEWKDKEVLKLNDF